MTSEPTTEDTAGPWSTAELLAAIPDALLFSRDRHARSYRLLRWCERRNFTPLLQEIEDERQRRRDVDRIARGKPARVTSWA